MNNYQNGKIYKIVNKQNNNMYIGSTYEKLSNRFSKHKHDFKRYTNGTFHYITSFEIFKTESPEIILIEEYPCNSKKELCDREAYYIREFNCVNKQIPNNKLNRERVNKQKREKREKLRNEKKQPLDNYTIFIFYLLIINGLRN
jgi:hypothetical protein